MGSCIQARVSRIANSGANHRGPADLHRWYAVEGRTLVRITRQHYTARDTVCTWLQTAVVSVQPGPVGSVASTWIPAAR